MASNFTALVENVITCPICLKHFDEPRMLPYHPDLTTPMCHRCGTDVAEHWCDSDCKHCFCSKCWDSIHEVGQYRNHTKCPVRERPPEIPRCQEHEHDDDKVKYWCEGCSKEICNNCQQLKHKDHSVILVTGDVNPLEEKCKTGLQGVQLCLNYRSNRVDKLLTEIEEEKDCNKSKVKEAMASCRQLIDEQEKVLLENIENVEKDQKKPIEDYKRRLQGEQQGLIEQVLNFMIDCKDKQPRKQLEAKARFEEYITRTDEKLLELKPIIRTANYISGLEKLREMEGQIRNIKVEEVVKYENQQLRQRITNAPDKSTLNLGNLNLTDLDMEIVAAELEINKTLKTLQLYTNQISDIGAQHLADALRMNKTLTDLQLYKNQIGTNGLQDFADALRTNKTLSTLAMYQNKIEDETAQYIADELKNNQEMEAQIRNLNVVPVPKYENQQLQQRIANNGNNTTLDLRSSNLTDQDMEIVARQLKTNTTLTLLQLQQNQIGDEGARHLGDALKVNQILTQLYLGTNQISDNGAQYFADALKTNKALTHLHLYQNQIGDNGAQHLADGLKVNKVSCF
ncbi:unnamed protein product [Adineta steineri]|uniref:B box-type domain-containing protein n=1 Tax=Adineta steineri TaxID=433720 RepID=A0A815XB11_9BILA|nr:unnamed protein product [Adineta steineri]CAF1555177.1 unnamed protein product [Adineta steineri]